MFDRRSGAPVGSSPGRRRASVEASAAAKAQEPVVLIQTPIDQSQEPSNQKSTLVALAPLVSAATIADGRQEEWQRKERRAAAYLL